ncbi:MAG: HAMP domain-containing methyl-accepting chemotaxis protein [Treponemataceae bacterium]
MIVSLSAAVSVYFVILNPITRIEKERAVLDDLGVAIRAALVELNKLDSTTFQQQKPIFEAALVRMDEAFKNLQLIEYLRKYDKNLAEAIQIVEDLQSMNLINIQSLKSVYEYLYKDAVAVFDNPAYVSFSRFYSPGSVPPNRKTALELALMHLASFDSAIGQLNGSLEVTVTTIGEQSLSIADRIKAIRDRALLLSAIAVAVLVIVVLAFSILAANSIAKNVIKLAAGVRRLKDGDLSVVFDIKGRDEVVTLSQGMNEFIHSLDGSVLGIKDAAARSSRVRDQMADAARLTGSSLDQLRGTVRDVEKQAERLDDRISETKESVKTIATGVGALDDRITDQIAMVEESTASITQMLATISNMAQLAEKDRHLADLLVQVSDSGREVFKAAFDKIELINERVGKIEEMIQIIDTIAGQTNLLAMNAAIEAAHAGESGKGFAVVSDEIRKLAEASAEGSREIAGSVRSIVESIALARAGSFETNKAFGEIESNIRDVSQSVVEISSSLGETNIGGKQILTAMTSLRELSASINEESRNVSESARTIAASMEDLDQVADSVRESMVSIGGRSDEISQTAERTSGLAEELAAVGSDLEARIVRFKTSCEDADGTITEGGGCETEKSSGAAAS